MDAVLQANALRLFRMVNDELERVGGEAGVGKRKHWRNRPWPLTRRWNGPATGSRRGFSGRRFSLWGALWTLTTPPIPPDAKSVPSGLRSTNLIGRRGAAAAVSWVAGGCHPMNSMYD